MMRFSRTMAAGALLSSVFLVAGLAYADPSSYIDEHNRFILNGEPFFPLGLYVAQCSTFDQSEQLNEIAAADSPFDTLMNYNTISCGGAHAEDAQITNYLNQLQSRELKLVFSLFDYLQNCENTDVLSDSDINAITEKVSTFKDHPAVIAWYINDERSPACLPELEVGYETIRALDDAHPIWSVHWNKDWLLPENHTTDIAGMDSYPIAHLPITEVGKMADAAAATGKPFWMVPQIFSWTDYPGDPRASTGRPPTQEEMRAMTYLATNHGAKGLIYYSYFNIRDDEDYETRWPQIKEIASEVQALRAVFLSIDQTNDNDILCSRDDVIDWKLMRQGELYYLFAVNTAVNGEGDPVSVTGVSFEINMDLLPTAVHTIFEDGRQLVVEDKKFADQFGPYEVHVYYWGEGDIDGDRDGILDAEDNCPGTFNPGQEDSDSDGVGDECDNCRNLANVDQTDSDSDGVGDVCDNCPNLANVDQTDSDNDGAGNLCDNCPTDPHKKEPGVCGCFTPDVDSDHDGTADCNDGCPNDPQKTVPGICGCGEPDTDSDGDGILDCEEQGPDGSDVNYSGNDDSKADRLQSNVTSLHTYDGQHYVTLSVSDPATFNNCRALDNPHPDDAPARREFPYGFFAFEVTGFQSPPGCAEVKLFLPQDPDIKTYYRYGPTPGTTDHHWYEFVKEGETGAEIIQEDTLTKVVLHLCDGERGDDDLITTNGTIVDPGGPASITPSSGGGGGGGGCFLATAVRKVILP